MSSRFDVNFFDPDVIVDPYPLYEEIRATGRVVWNDVIQMWMTPGFDDCKYVLSNPTLFSNALYRDPEKVWWFEARNMVQSDPPEHQRLRGPLAPMFTRSAVAKYEARAREVVDELLAPLESGAGEFDVIRDFTMIPTIILAEMIGVPPSRREDFRRWSATIAGSLAYGMETEDEKGAMLRASDELRDYMIEELERHRRERPDDLLTAMLDLPPEANMSEAEIRSTVSVLLLAGYDTTAKLMSNCLVVLERHPDQRRLVADDLSQVPAMIEEVLRWWGVLHGVNRTAEEDTELAGQPIGEGELVCTLPAAANRDPERWHDPLTFDVRRAAKSHMGFGQGIHLCIGAALARLEVKVAMERFLQLAPNYSLAEIDYGNAWFIRGPRQGKVQIPEPASA